MLDGVKDDTKILCFLTSDGSLPRWFVDFSKGLAHYNITTVPITLDQLKDIQKNFSIMDIFVVDDDFVSHRWLNQKLKSHLGFSLRTHALRLYHLSSFQKIPKSANYEKGGAYFYYQLPVKVKELVDQVVYNFYSARKQSDVWPGGRKGSLPQKAK